MFKFDYFKMFKIFNIKLTKLQIVTNLRSLCYKSEISLEKLYPNSKLNLHTLSPPDNNKKFNGYIPLDQLKITYSRSTGPGGQNVNCVNTKVDVRFNVKEVQFISEEIKEKLLEDYKNQINKEGQLVLRSDVTRSQKMNLADALEKLRTIIRHAEIPKTTQPSTETLEKLRKRQERAASIRLHTKRERSITKESRQGL